MSKSEHNFVDVSVINSNTGNIVRKELIISSDTLMEVAKKYATKESIVITSIDKTVYCVYRHGEFYELTTINSPYTIELIEFFNDVSLGLYDYSRDAYHIRYGRVSTLLQFTSECPFIDLLECIDSIWNTRYYSKFIKDRCKSGNWAFYII